MTTATDKSRSGAVAFVWQQFGAYHMDRCEAVGRALAARRPILGIELGTQSDTYHWDPSGDGRDFVKLTLFPGKNVDRLSRWDIFRALLGTVRRERVRHLFIAGYEQPALFAVALLARLGGVRVYVSLDSKFDDKPRRISMELLKWLLMLPYHGAFAAGPRTREYLRFLGFRRRPIVMGYDTVSVERIRSLAPPSEPGWTERPFLIVARFVPKKNLSLALRAFDAYRATTTGPVRRLRLCGSGPLAGELRALAETLAITDLVDFVGFVDQGRVAVELSRALCLLLPSWEEQWGLVVNEALAFSLPLLVSENVGARDMLVGTLDNGFVLEPDNVAAWAAAMTLLADDRPFWERMRDSARKRSLAGDVGTFVAGVETLIASGELVSPALRAPQFTSARSNEAQTGEG